MRIGDYPPHRAPGFAVLKRKPGGPGALGSKAGKLLK